jgi:PAP_fibrillin
MTRRSTQKISIANLPHGDPRRIEAKFAACRVVTVAQTPIAVRLPLQEFGGRPRGWFRTTFVDDDFRITRGNKGSIFILCHPMRM